MRLIRIENLKPGLIIGRALLDENGKILLNADVPLTETYIRALESKGIPSIYIREDDEMDSFVPDEDLDPEVRSHALSVLRKAYDDIEEELADLRDESFDTVKEALSSRAIKALSGADGPLANIDALVDEIFRDVLTRATLAGLTSIKGEDDRLHNHSIDVCIIAIMIGKAVELESDRMRQLATGCLLHDIGKLFMDKTAGEISQVRQHTLLGYELLKAGSDSLAPNVALEHHERQDGKGQPRGLVGSNTIWRNRNQKGPVPTLVGEVAAVANVYDNLLSGTPTRPPLTPEKALQTMDDVAGTHLNSAVVRAFRRVVPVYPLGTDVLVRGDKHHNFRGIVSKINPDHLDKPVVLVTKDNRGKGIEAFELDMLTQKTLSLRAMGLG